MSTLFASVELAPRDPILGLNEQYNADTRPGKVNLGVGVYYDDEGRIPLLQAVRKAEVARIEAAAARGYLPIEGIAGYNKGAQALLLGADSPLAAEGRVLTAQALGGTGALKIGADFLRQLLPQSKVLISDPSWENHRALFERAGFPVETYAYYDAATHGLNFEAMLAALQAAPEQTIVVLHACCHNPTGVDPTPQQWEQIAAVVKARNLVPFLDIAYQGFGEGLEQDAAVVRMFAALDLTMFISSSFSKSFSLYGERVGALTVVAGSKDEAARVLSQLKRVIRTNYSNPPTHGGTVVSTVLNTPELFALWENELAGMRDRIRLMRKELVEKIKAQGVAQDFSFVLAQRGMFSYSGLTATQVDRLREEHGIYAVSSGRICVAALNSRNIDAVAAGIAAVLK
ncbi:amino acid aminotransferase [Bordetella bronchiseptica]|uniref:amino acid aminotransferase n=1 Tax=Bordetella bronchiseptica TaxID=518 RepID=UPI000444BDC5|nr:amino acid aminotransferase [Bordetella bronchiseptica]AWP85277.1 aromatic amino acid aminotransferase [Bordetella bronchiseptica]AWQ10853.1 aromatic amino acid aminotransferase [Bordetella bronchiseptica]AXT89491.1 aspartate/tyrosine/aromatic aminotransferase [Bordetella bronchiseptica]KDB82720.1 aminotransferase, class I/II [Bordetella bronchiseptica CARE970018BB]KDC91452.1 aminotransferase, class I/II [Bordetella bronchiseptica MBORD670]